MTRLYVHSLTLLCVFLFSIVSVCGQEDESEPRFKNLVSTNLMYPIFESFEITYERTMANKWAIGLAGAIYGNSFNELSSTTSNYGTKFDTNYEVTPFARFYFQGAQNKSHFVELMGSISWVEETGSFVRSNNPEGFGVYNREFRLLTLGGLGMGYGYRFLFLDKRLVLEAQVGFRTNFGTNFIAPTGVPVHTGIKVGFRF